MINNFDITKIEDDFIGLVRGLKITDKIYTDRRKAADTADDFIVVRITGGIHDYATFGECTLSVRLFARDIANATNAKKLSYMQTKLLEGLQLGYKNYLYDECPNVLGDTSDDLGFHARIINIKTTIKIA